MASFRDCVIGELAARRVGEKRSKIALERYDGLTKKLTAEGHALPENEAARRMLNELEFERNSNKWRKLNDLATFAAWGERLDDFNRNQNLFWRPGSTDSGDYSMAVRAGIEGDQRAGHLSFAAHYRNAQSELYSLMGEGMAAATKGLFGRQKGKAHLRNFIPELAGRNTGDAAAAELAAGWRAMTEAVPRLWREAGGAMNEIRGVYLPEPESAVRLNRHGQAAYVQDAMQRVDWDRTTWPDGSPIDPAAREDFLKSAWETKTMGGANKLGRMGMRGTGRAFGNRLDQHRIIHFKSPVEWQEMFDKYGDGSIFDMMVHYIEDTAHHLGMIRTWGSNPEIMYQSVKARALAMAAKADLADTGPKSKRTSVSLTQARFDNLIDPMMEVSMRRNPMDPESLTANTVTGIGNVITSAVLGSASVLAVPGDYITTIAARMANGYKPGRAMFGGMDHYLQALITDPAMAERIGLRTGFVMDEAMTTMNAMQRYTGVATYGPAFTRRLADITLRSSFLTPHTKASRYAVRLEQMGMLHDTMGTRYSEHPMRDVFRRYGIEEADWDEFRRVMTPYSPRPGVNLLAPIDILQTSLAPGRRRELYDKFQGMIWEESRTMVIDARVEGSVRFKDTTRPDTLPGALLHSLAMYKSFPTSLLMAYSRLAMAQGTRGSRLALLGGLGAGLTLAGAFGTQMREVASGRDPMAMDDPKFWGRAVLSGGALGVFGDFLFSGINEYGRGVEDVAAGPVFLFASDFTQLSYDTGYSFLHMADMIEEAPKTPLGGKMVQFARKYTPGSNIWWSKLLLHREMFDRLELLADPRAYKRHQRQVRRRQREYGQDYFSPPGTSITDMRAPSLEGLFDGNR